MTTMAQATKDVVNGIQAGLDNMPPPLIGIPTPVERSVTGCLTIMLFDEPHNFTTEDATDRAELKAWLFDLIVKFPSQAQKINAYFKACVDLDVFKMKEFRIVVNSESVLIWTRN